MAFIVFSFMLNFFHFLFLHRKATRVLLFCLIAFFVCFNSYSTPLIPFIPDKINIPAQLKKRNSTQIKVIFSSLEAQNKNKTANLWFLNYKKALLLKNKDKDSFCEIMKDLSLAPAFPLKELALIQSYEVCPYSSKLVFNPDAFPKWLRLRLAKAFYKRRKFDQDSEQTLKATIYLAKNSSYKDLKISYLKHALFLAKEEKKDQESKKISLLLYKEAPRLNPNPEFKDYLSVARDFRRNRKFRKAIHFYVKLLNSPKAGFNEKNLSFQGLSQVYTVQRNHKKKIINSKQWSEWLLKENTKQSLIKYYKRRLELARQKWNFNENESAITLLTNILKETKFNYIKAEAFYLRGLIYVQESKPELSLADWNRAIQLLRKKKNSSSLLEKVLWKKAWLLRGQKKYRQAVQVFNFLERVTKNTYTKYKILFWLGKTSDDLGRKALAKKYYKLLIKKDQFGYYGLLALKMLDKPIVFQKHTKEIDSISFLKDQKTDDLIHWLILFEEVELLSQFLDLQKSKFLNQKKQTEQDWLKVILLYTKAKKHLEVFQSLDQMDSDVKKSFLKKYTYLLFPLDFFEEVQKASKKWNVPPALIFSVIRQESAFNIRARSPADAFGLMQLIPSTARETARRFNISYRNFRDLYRPSKNISLGTAHLKILLKRYNNNFLFSVAAYNAGGTPLKKWRKEMKGLEALEFIENIPYEETRTYVRLIIRNYIFYQQELSDEDSWFSEWLSWKEKKL